MIQAVLTAAVVAALLIVSLAGPASADDDDDDGGEYVPRQVVVKLQPAADISAINRKYDTTTISRLPGGEKIYLLRTPPGVNPANLAGRIALDTRVIYAETNFRAGSPEASRSHRGWPGGIPRPSSDAAKYRDQYAVGALNLVDAHGITGGADSVVAVIDTGLQASHPEFSGKMTGGYDFVDGDSRPADVGNGKDDDRDGLTDEMVGHGTHVAGIVGLVAPEAQIMPVRALDSEGRGTTFGIARAIRFAVRNGADVVNLSLGSSQESDLLEDLIEDDDDDSSGRGAVFVAAAGNDKNSVEQYPAAEDGAIAVTSVNPEKKKSGFANYGPWVTIAAPGNGIYSPFPTSRYASWSGTSMATPFVAGQAALIRSLQPSAGSECVTEIIRATAQPLVASDPTYASQLGSGQADVGASTVYAQSNECPAEDD
jgi:subtilisin family serine protease